MPSYMVFVEACDYFEIEASSEDQARSDAVDLFVNYPRSAAYSAEVIRVTENNGAQVYPEGTDAA